MLRSIGEDVWLAESGVPGTRLCISFGVHGDERSPVDAGLRLVDELRSGGLELAAGELLLVHANPRATAADQRWSAGGVDLNRCFQANALARNPKVYEEGRAREIVAVLERVGAQVLVDFHCTAEPGRRFLMHHPPPDDEAHRRVRAFLRADILLADPALEFGGVSLDEWMSTRGRVGICYETGWVGDPNNTPEYVLEEMKNLLGGLEMVRGISVRRHPEEDPLQLERVLRCEEEGFVWREGIGENLQPLPAAAVLGSYASGREVVLEEAATLIFPKKRPELVQVGEPLVYLARRAVPLA